MATRQPLNGNLEVAITMYKNGATLRDIGKRFKCSHTALYHHLKEKINLRRTGERSPAERAIRNVVAPKRFSYPHDKRGLLAIVNHLQKQLNIARAVIGRM